MISLDLTARKVIMSSMLYYGLDEPILSDGEFDEYCKRLAKEWDNLDNQRQFCLGSPEKISTSGFHVKVSMAAEMGAISWLITEGRYDVKGPRKIFRTLEPKHSKVVGRWLPCNAYQWGERDDYPPPQEFFF